MDQVLGCYKFNNIPRDRAIPTSEFRPPSTQVNNAGGANILPMKQAGNVSATGCRLWLGKIFFGQKGENRALLNAGGVP